MNDHLVDEVDDDADVVRDDADPLSELERVTVRERDDGVLFAQSFDDRRRGLDESCRIRGLGRGRTPMPCCRRRGSPARCSGRLTTVACTVSATSSRRRGAGRDRRPVVEGVGTDSVLGHESGEAPRGPHEGCATYRDDRDLEARFRARQSAASERKRAAPSIAGYVRKPHEAQVGEARDCDCKSRRRLRASQPRCGPCPVSQSTRTSSSRERRAASARPGRSRSSSTSRTRRRARVQRGEPFELVFADEVVRDQHVVDPGVTMTSASPTFWQVIPRAPSATWRRAISTDLCVFTWGRFARPTTSQCACQRARLRCESVDVDDDGRRVDVDHGGAGDPRDRLDLDADPAGKAGLHGRPGGVRLVERGAVDLVEARRSPPGRRGRR